MQFLVSRHAEVVTEASARDGEAEYSETVYSDQPMTARETIEELREMAYTSSYPIRSAEQCAGAWALSHEEIDHATGESRTESIHIRNRLGGDVPGRQLFRLFRAANLI